MTKPSLLMLTTTAAASLALGVGLAACVRTASGPLPQAQGQPPGDSTAARGGGASGSAMYGDALYGGAGYGAVGFGIGGAGYGGEAYGNGFGSLGFGIGGAGYGGDAYGGASYGTPPPPPPRPPAPVAKLYACHVDSDCSLIFRSQGCFASDPIGVATAQLAEARRQITVRRDECGMGGPDYERRRQQNEGRYGVTCTQQRCTAIDRGPQPTIFDRMRPD